MPDLEIGEVTTPDALEALRPEWAALWDRCPDATPFQSPEWVIAWVRQFGANGLWVLTLRRTGRLVGLLPLFIWHDPQDGARKALLIGTGISDYLDALMEPGAEDGAGLLLAHVVAHRQRWDVCEFHQLRSSSPLRTVSVPGCQGDEAAGDPCPVLRLADPAAGLEGCVPQKLRTKLRYDHRRAARIGPVRIDRATEADFDELFDALLRLHAARWSASGEAGVLADESVQRFHRTAARGLLRAGVLRLYGLRLAGRLVASVYAFQTHGRLYSYLGGFDPAAGAISPCTLLLEHAIQEAIREGWYRVRLPPGAGGVQVPLGGRRPTDVPALPATAHE